MEEIHWEPKDREQAKQLRGRRTDAQMRDEIQAALHRRPMNTHELTRAVNTSWRCCLRHLRWLAHLGIVVSYETKYEGERITLWRLNK